MSLGKPSSQAVDLQVIHSVGEDVGGLMNSNLQGDKARDGTTSMVVWPRELLREAEKLLAMKIKPMTIIAGYTGSASFLDNVRNTVNNWPRCLEEKRWQQQAATKFRTDAKRQIWT
ncbi:T-complex protein 1 subunit beta [Tanacetum coccineum]